MMVPNRVAMVVLLALALLLSLGGGSSLTVRNELANSLDANELDANEQDTNANEEDPDGEDPDGEGPNGEDPDAKEEGGAGAPSPAPTCPALPTPRPSLPWNPFPPSGKGPKQLPECKNCPGGEEGLSA